MAGSIPPDPELDLLLDERDLSRLRWGCRRGMLENDIFLERFMKRHGTSLTVRRARALTDLLHLSDNDLLNLHLGKKTLAQVDIQLDRGDVLEVLGMLRETAKRAKNETS
jgi:antitoxin CptB